MRAARLSRLTPSTLSVLMVMIVLMAMLSRFQVFGHIVRRHLNQFAALEILDDLRDWRSVLGGDIDSDAALPQSQIGIGAHIPHHQACHALFYQPVGQVDATGKLVLLDLDLTFVVDQCDLLTSAKDGGEQYFVVSNSCGNGDHNPLLVETRCWRVVSVA